MTTYTLTPNTANAITGLKNPVLGWHFTGATFGDVYEGMQTIRKGGWNPTIEVDPTDTTNTLYQLQVTQGGHLPQLAKDTDWFTFDGYFVRVLSQTDVTDNYTTAAVPGT